MNLYKLSQNTNMEEYDTYDSAVVVANTPDEARNIKVGSVGDYGSWVAPKDVKVELIGMAVAKYKKAQIIVASFNAG